ncbi:DUF4198 domain-containing protein [Geofilum rubicundum]|nr:DUF4198 domain-containing protein [Geofilum rubicundum]
MKIKTIILFLFPLLAFVAFSAHVPFLKPNQFVVLHNRFQVESSFTEDPFQADFAMHAPVYYLIDPHGDQSTIAPAAKTSAAVYLEPLIADSGTYRIHAAPRKGPQYRGVETEDGKKYFSDDTLRVAGKKITLQYFSSADTYVCKGKPDYTPTPLNHGVEIIPLSPPNALKVGEPVNFRVLRDGQAVAHARMVVAYDNEHYVLDNPVDLYDVENQRRNNVFADGDGLCTFIPEKPGLVLLFVTIHENIGSNRWESHNNSLTLEIRGR